VVNHKKIFTLLLSFTLFLILALSTNCAETAPPTDEQRGRSFAWEISSDSTVVYLLGSIHVAQSGIYPLDKAIEEAFAGADNLVVEVDVTAVDETATVELLQQYGLYPDGDGLNQNMPKDIYDELNEYLMEFEVPLVLLDKFRPWVILITFEQLAYESLGYVAEYGIDNYFLEKAKVDEKQIIELESAEFQFEILSSIPDDVIIKVIEMDLDEMLTSEDAEKLFTVWADGDRETMEELLFEGLISYPELEPYYEATFSQRNFGMMQKIEEFLAGSETYFIVVGAGHLVGDEGLLQLLEDRGYTLEQFLNSD
jgi:uncharacterized protein YbaP (TraB family)